jgi:putative membrane protein
MKKIFKVFFIDVHNIRKSRASIIMIIGLCFLPSLYAWINIAACWNPYANTGNIPVAVVNDDEGADFNGKKVNVGASIVADLKKNKSIDWVFVDQWQGNYGLNEGRYYSLLEIPNNFSSGLLSLTTTTPEKPSIIYRSNEKLNAIASKITNTAKDKVAKELKTNFVSMVSKEALKITNSTSSDLKVNKSSIVQLKDTLNEATKDVTTTKKYISDASSSSENLQQYLSSLKNNLPKVTDQINSLQNATESSKTLVTATRQTINRTSNDLNNDMLQIQSTNGQIQNLLSKLKDENNSADTTNMVNTISELIDLNSSLDNIIKADIKSLQSISNTNPNTAINNLVSSLKDLDSLVTNEKNALTDLRTSILTGSSKDKINSNIDSLASFTNQISVYMLNTSNNFYSTVSPVLNNIGDTLNTNLDDVNSLLETTKVIVPQLNALASYGISSSELSVTQANELSNRLSSLLGELTDLSDKMNTLSDHDLDQIIKLLAMNPNDLSSFISSPLDVKEVDVYGEGIFGVGLTPFYSVLAIWVGVLLLSSLLTTEFKNHDSDENFNIWQKHFGKMLLFLIISFAQSTIITLGDKYILGVKPENMLLMLCFALTSSVTFTLIIFTLVSIFGNIGKAIAVIIMVFQIAGAGGIYPIQTNPKIFGILEPLWPFTYSINGFREAIAGPIWSNVYKNFIALGYFALFFFAFTILKKPFHKLTEAMEQKFKESGL